MPQSDQLGGEFRGKVALVTGGATGIGAACVRSFAAAGAQVAIVARASRKEMEALCAELSGNGAHVRGYLCDMTDQQAVRDLVGDVAADFGALHYAVNNAGIYMHTPIFGTDDDDAYDKVLATNLGGPYELIRAALPVIRRSGGGAIVNVSSSTGVLGSVTYGLYSASKAALIHLSRTLAPELRNTNIRINCVAPGAVRTPMTIAAHTPTTPQGQAAYEAVKRQVPSPHGDPFLDPEDIANVVLFLSSDAARGLNGATIVVDQGLSATDGAVLNNDY